MNYNIIILGTGGREASMVSALRKSKHNLAITAIGSNYNPTMVHYSVNIVNLKNRKDIVNYILESSVDLVIVGPEKYLEEGFVDELQKYGIKCVGPTQKLARLETDKYYARNLLMEIESDTKYYPDFKIFKNYNELELTSFIQSINNSFVVKNIGLCGGKGVKVMGYDFDTVEEGLQYCKELIETTGNCLIEEKLEGLEFTLMSYTDGSVFRHMPVAHDYKRLLNDNDGPQTGGMGCVINNKKCRISNEKTKEAQLVNELVIKKLQEDNGEKYKGIVYGSFILLNKGDNIEERIKVIEYNCRFGDPEVIAVLSLLETDFMEICLGIVNNKLKDVEVNHSNESVCLVYVAPQGYPTLKSSDESGYITVQKIDDNMIFANATVTDEKNNIKLLTSRSVAVTGKGDNLSIARNRTMELVKTISGPIYYRTDIGINLD